MLGVILALEPVFYNIVQAVSATNWHDTDYFRRGHFHFWKSLAMIVGAVNKCIETFLSCLDLIAALLDSNTTMEESEQLSPPSYTVSALFGRCFCILTVAT